MVYLVRLRVTRREKKPSWVMTSRLMMSMTKVVVVLVGQWRGLDVVRQ